MIDSLVFIGTNGQSVSLNTDTYPLQTFDMEIETTTDERQKPNAHGMFNTNTWMSKRTFHMEGDIFGADSADFNSKRQQLIGPFVPSPEYGFNFVGTLAIKFTGVSETVTAECYLDGLPQAPLEALSPARGTFAISLNCFDITLYGQNVITVETGVPGAGSGFTFPFTFNFNFPGASSGGDVNVVNGGNAPVYPAVTVYGPCKTPSLLLSAFGNVYAFTLDGLVLNDGESVQIDFRRRTVITNTAGSAYSYVAPGSVWWQIPPGTSQVSFRAFQASGNAKMVLTYTNGYML